MVATQFRHSRGFQIGTYVLVLLLVSVFLYTQGADLRQVLAASGRVHIWWLLAGCVAMAASVICTAAIYRSLSPSKLRFAALLLVQTSGLFVNKLLPSGAGAAGVSYLFLRANRLTALQAGIIVVINNGLGFVGHVALLLGTAIVFWPGVLPPTGLRGYLPHVSAIYAVGAAAGCAVLGTVTVRYRTAALSRRMGTELRALLWRRGTAYALLWSMALTACYVVALYAACRGADLTVSPARLLAVLTLSVAATAVMPVPGGIGAAEAGIFIGLRMFNIEAPAALLVALLYRLMTFWLPLIVGGVAMVSVKKKGLLHLKNVK